MTLLRQCPLILLAICLWIPAATPRPTHAAVSPPEFVSGEIIVRFQDNVTLPDAKNLWTSARLGLSGQSYRLPVLQAESSLHAVRLAVSAGAEVAMARALQGDPLIRWAEPNYMARATVGPQPQSLPVLATRLSANGVKPAAQMTSPNDPLYASQWPLSLIHAEAAWDVTTGRSDIVVAHLDTGVDLSHPDFAGKLEQGYNYVADNTVPQDDSGHGSHVAGLLAAVTNNGTAIAGVSWGAHLRPYKVLGQDESGSYYNLALAIRAAIALNCRIINMSLAGQSDSDTLREAVIAAANAGVLMVAAAGNEYGGQVDYPAAYPQVLSVAASTAYDEPANYSSQGTRVDVAAPGGAPEGQVVSLWLDRSTATKYGTSQSTPIVSGIASLVWSVAPNLSADEVRQIIMTTADHAGSLPYVNGRNDKMGSGRVNAERAVKAALPLAFNPAQIRILRKDQPRSQTLLVRLLPTAFAFAHGPMTWHAETVQGNAANSLPKIFYNVSPASGMVYSAAPTLLYVTIERNNLYYNTWVGVLRITTSLGTTQDIAIVVTYSPNAHSTYLPLFGT